MRLRLFRLLYALGAKKRLSDVLARNHQFSGIPIGTSASEIDRRLSGDCFKHSGEVLNSGKTAF